MKANELKELSTAEMIEKENNSKMNYSIYDSNLQPAS